MRKRPQIRRILSGAALAIVLLLPTSPASAVVYGDATGPGRYTNVGAMLVDEGAGPQPWCSGTLISPRVFLTAGHCVAPLVGHSSSRVYVTFVDDLAVLRPRQLYGVDVGRSRVHPGYGHDRSDLFDVGVLVLTEDADEGRSPARLAPAGYLDDQRAIRDQDFVSVGYGVIRESQRKAWQGLLPNTERRFGVGSFRSLRKAWLMLSQNIATGDAGTCYGDSGGPNFHGRLVVSITSTGDRPCKSLNQTYRIDTRAVRAFLDDFVRLD